MTYKDKEIREAKTLQRKVTIDYWLQLHANFYAAQTGLDPLLFIEEALKDRIKKIQSEFIGEKGGIVPQEEIEALYRREGKARGEPKRYRGIPMLTPEGLLIHEIPINRQVFKTAFYYTFHDGITFDKFLEGALNDRLDKVEEEIGYFSDDEIAERHDRKIERMTKEIESAIELGKRNRMTKVPQEEADKQRKEEQRRKEAGKHPRKINEFFG